MIWFWIALVATIVGLGLYWRHQARNRQLEMHLEIESNRYVEQEGEVSPDDIPHPDPLFRQAVAMAANSGKMVIANRDEDGDETIDVCDKED